MGLGLFAHEGIPNTVGSGRKSNRKVRRGNVARRKIERKIRAGDSIVLLIRLLGGGLIRLESQFIGDEERVEECVDGIFFSMGDFTFVDNDSFGFGRTMLLAAHSGAS